MKKLVTLVAAAVASIGVFATVSVGIASAQSNNCSITGTGQGSVNTCVNTTTNIVTVTCNNGVQLTNTNPQSAISGTVTVNGNTISGTATSGAASNTSTLAADLALNCAPVQQAVATPTPTGGMGGGTVAAATTVTALPKTGNMNALTVVSAVVLGSAAIALASRLVVAGYRRK